MYPPKKTQKKLKGRSNLGTSARVYWDTRIMLTSPNESIENVRVFPATGDQPPAPLHYDENYILPPHREKLLQGRYPHPLDSAIEFFEEPHIYTVNGVPVICSITTIANEFTAPFDPMLAIRAMKRSKAWPRLQYVTNARRITHVDEFSGQKGALIHNVETDTTVSTRLPPMDGDGIITYTILNDRIYPSVDENKQAWYTFDRAMTDDEIKQAWNTNGENARNRGTEAHLQMELWFNSEACRLNDPEVQVGLQFVQEQLVPHGARAYRTEWEIHAKDENVAGSIDLVLLVPAFLSRDECKTDVVVEAGGCVDDMTVVWSDDNFLPGTYRINGVRESRIGAWITLSNGTSFQNPSMLYIVDWKRSEKLPKKLTGRPMGSPLNHLDDCSGCTYALQLGLYQYVLEKYYGFRVKGRALVSLHPAAPFVTTVPYLQDEVEYLMQRQRNLHETRTTISTYELARPYICCESGVFSTQLVRCTDGRVVDFKYAKLNNLSTVECEDLSTQAQAFLEHHIVPIPYTGQSIRWKTRFSKCEHLFG